MAWLIWLGLAAALVVIEIITVDLIFLMLAGGALAGAVVGGFGLSWPLQAVAAAVVAVALLAFVRPWAKGKLRRSSPNEDTNVGALPGKQAEVLATVTQTDGRVKLVGEVWSARTAQTEAIMVGEMVRVMKIDGATAIVTKLEG